MHTLRAVAVGMLRFSALHPLHPFFIEPSGRYFLKFHATFDNSGMFLADVPYSRLFAGTPEAFSSAIKALGAFVEELEEEMLEEMASESNLVSADHEAIAVLGAAYPIVPRFFFFFFKFRFPRDNTLSSETPRSLFSCVGD